MIKDALLSRLSGVCERFTVPVKPGESVSGKHAR